MTPLELENNIARLSTEYIYNKAVSSLFLLLLSCSEDIGENAFTKANELHPDLIALKEKIHNLTKNLEDTLKDEDKKIEALEASFGIKAGIVSIYENIYHYYAQWNIISSLISDEVALRKYKEQDNKEKEIELSLFYTDCMEFVQNADDPSQQKSFMGQLFKCVPLKMGRDKYFDIVAESLAIAFGGESEESIKTSLATFKNTCAPEKSADYGKYFPDIAESLTEKMNIKPSTMTEEELDTAFDDMNDIFETLTEIEDYCQEILSASNSLIILHYLNFTLENLTEADFGHIDVYYKVCELLSTPPDDVFLETVTTLLEEFVEPAIDKANELNKREMDLLKKVKSFDDFDVNTNKTLASEAFVRSTFYGDLNEEIFNFGLDPDAPAAGEDFKKEAFSNFIAFMREYFAELSFTVRKSAMQMLLSSLPIAMDIHQLMDYIKDGIDTAPTFEHGLLIIDKAGTIFTENGFDYHTEDDHHHDHEHVHHDHGCNCGCDHEHHH